MCADVNEIGLKMLIGLILLAAATVKAQLYPKCVVGPEVCNNTYVAYDEFYYDLYGGKINLSIDYHPGRDIKLECNSNLTLEDKAWPALDKEAGPTPQVHITSCPVPKRGYNEVFKELGLQKTQNLRVSNLQGPYNFTNEVFSNLTITTLTLLTSNDSVFMSEDALKGLPLKFLELRGIRITQLNIPQSVNVLKLTDSRMRVLPKIPQLQLLELRDDALEDVYSLEGKAIQTLLFDAPNAHPSDNMLSNVSKLTLMNVNATGLGVQRWWGRCDVLEALALQNSDVYELPTAWLQGCSRLGTLKLSVLNNLETIGSRLAANCPRLENVTIYYCTRLSYLADDLFAGSTNLRSVEIKHTGIHLLSGGLLLGAVSTLRDLSLSHNQLTDSVLDTVGSLVNLTTLMIDHNPLDACPGSKSDNVLVGFNGKKSKLHNLRNLQKLSLEQTRTSSICEDWMDQLLQLTYVDLSRTPVNTVMYHDLLWSRTADTRTTVYLENIQNLTFFVNQYDYDYAVNCSKQQVKGSCGEFVTIKLRGAALQCDCFDGWMVKAMRDGVLPMTFEPELQCNDTVGGLAKDRNPELLECLAEDEDFEDCPNNCTCSVRYNGQFAVKCSDAGLTRLPQMPNQGIVELIASHNALVDLTLEDLPVITTLKVLDVRNNSIESISEDVVTALWGDMNGGRSVLLAGNPLVCDCSALDLWHALRTTNNESDATCADGKLLVLEPLEHQCLMQNIVLAAIIVLAIVACGVFGWVFFSSRLAASVKAVLLPHRVIKEPARTFDAFISYFHEDEELAERIKTRLERDYYRTCVHYRDWTPGQLIPAQIIRSVHEARRTLAILTERFARSEWAPAELTAALSLQAREHMPRLVVVVVGDPKKVIEHLPEDLKTYMENNTYLEWGDHFFWTKLYRALGPPNHLDDDNIVESQMEVVN